jgi:hypothetical protein
VVATFHFSGPLWASDRESAWVFVTLPADDASEIRELAPQRPGFGSVRVTAQIVATGWQTSIFPDKASRSYVLPVKRPIRDRERVDVGDTVSVSLELMFD